MDDDYPGRMIEDSKRTPYGLGWEYARRKWGRDKCPLRNEDNRRLFQQGFGTFTCSDARVNAAMLNKPTKPKEPS